MRKVYRISLFDTITNGFIAGAIGITAMTLGEKVEQGITGRPSSYVPGHTLEKLLGLKTKPDSERFMMNHVMHFGQGILAGSIRSMMSAYGMDGPFSSFMFVFIRLMIDQSLENLTGVGAPPWTWPYNEQVIDILHKMVYAFVTGAVSDYLVTKKYIKTE
ncbi:uncharacterized protein B0P05DRAFT_520460 [Gilbertella persicaria]|uniref:uncharacterized protein n=1 Tax=Gilbertella persicaria TaxID=101096 RepID=UPI00221F1629|nr:uncharacterized protein B0P05DRAFT_520460 [Gilbertella persicaria]KAI8098117.1 hypothetical protein B0P05DRAFT_520460 [Gilbertella persicaria]